MYGDLGKNCSDNMYIEAALNLIKNIELLDDDQLQEVGRALLVASEAGDMAEFDKLVFTPEAYIHFILGQIEEEGDYLDDDDDDSLCT